MYKPAAGEGKGGGLPSEVQYSSASSDRTVFKEIYKSLYPRERKTVNWSEWSQQEDVILTLTD